MFADAGDCLLRADFDAGVALGALGVVDREVVRRVDRADGAGLHAELALDALGRVDGDVDERGARERFANVVLNVREVFVLEVAQRGKRGVRGRLAEAAAQTSRL